MLEINDSFLDKLIDWKEFEYFVADVYASSDEVKVEHDVTEIGKSNAKRQIDVKVTQITKLHKYVTIIECKRWKEPVTRQEIDVLFASVEDLNANKGVIFTTKGYEQGAIDYAKSKNIDIFIIRDVRDDEYAQPGKKFSLYLQMFNGRMNNIKFNNSRYFSLTNEKPTGPPPNFSINFTKDQEYKDELQLYSIEGQSGQNLAKLLIDVRADLLKRSSQLSTHVFQPDDKDHVVCDEIKVMLKFNDFKFRYLKYEKGYIIFDSIEFNFLRSISQSKMNFDRTSSLDLALVAENYITNQRNFISKRKGDEKINLTDPVPNNAITDQENAVKNGSVIKAVLEHYFDIPITEETKIINSGDLTVNLRNNE